MSKEFKELYKADILTYSNKPYVYTLYERRFSYLKRRVDTTKGLLNLIYIGLFYLHSFRHQMEIKPQAKIGKGLHLSHPYSITINKFSIIGENCTIYKGALLGGIAGGKRKGYPIVGNNCFIGMYATIVGGVTIGDNTTIAPNSFVNVDVPPNSIVFGNPAIIKEKK